MTARTARHRARKNPPGSPWWTPARIANLRLPPKERKPRPLPARRRADRSEWLVIRFDGSMASQIAPSAYAAAILAEQERPGIRQVRNMATGAVEWPPSPEKLARLYPEIVNPGNYP